MAETASIVAQDQLSRSTDRTRVRIGGIEIGGDRFVMVAGPCAIESEDQIEQTARLVAAEGAHVLRGGAFKARTSPYTFQGLGLDGVRMMRTAADNCRMPMITEVLSQRDLDAMEPYVDAFQVGSRNMDNTALLKDLGRIRKPILLKRGFAATIKEWILAAEYIVSGGNENVILCERGIRTFSTETRFTLDLAGAIFARQSAPFPVLIDPSHATGSPSLIPALSFAALAAGLDGLMIEVHPSPLEALSDGQQALTPQQFSAMMRQLKAIAGAVGRTL